MVLKTYKPTSPGLRQLVIVDRSELYKGAPEKSLTIGLTKTGGRDNFGHVTSRRKGGGHKRKLRIIDFRRNKFDMEATVERIEYDPNRSLGKAGRTRWLGLRPVSRGVAMNPVDHPMGGGEGRTSGGRHPTTPWGKPTKGGKTRSNKKTDRFIMRSRHDNKK